ncbi:kynureninase [Nakamurella flavida]|uniref:Kynureninase n=1 Tax=Nakamurella flavida TaxID=363630 RepID=A0A938YET7_9ACTN|nr:kynureninase [Nakamurella flavida]MBM9476360.1 kynureninase [Nakamurella flavida]MDP9779540.1 kynureninase [Nakamurella flavida]
MTSTLPATATSREDAAALDVADPLAHFRDRYLPLAPGVTAYLDGNSLGRPLAAIAERSDAFIREQWAGRLIRGWSEGWMELPEQVGDELAAATLGAAAGQTLIADSTTINFYKTLRAALALRPDRTRIVIDRDHFPTNRFVVESVVRDLGLEIAWLPGSVDGGVTVDALAEVLDERVAVVALSHVAYRSGHLADAAAITAATHRAGALVVWDLCHSVGACEIELDAWEVDFAVGCTYKFVGAGPGAPAFLYAAARHHDRLDQPLWGWLGRADPFEMEQGYRPAPGIRSMMSGTPSIPGVLAVREGARVIAEAGMPAVRAKAVALTELVVELADSWLAPEGFTLASPRDPARRGGHVSVARADARQVCAALVEAGVLPDFRTPDVVRLGVSPLPASFVEVWDALAVMREIGR